MLILSRRKTLEFFIVLPGVIFFSLLLGAGIRYLDVSALAKIFISPMFLLVLFLFVYFVSDKRDRLSVVNIYLVFYIFYYLSGVYFLSYMHPGVLGEDSISLIVISFFLSALGVKLAVHGRKGPEVVRGVVGKKKLLLILHFSMLFSIVCAVSWYVRIGSIPIFAKDVEYARIELARGTFLHRQLITTFIPFYLVYLASEIKERASNPSKKRSYFWLGVYFIIGSFLLISQGYRTFMLSFWFISILTVNGIYRNFISRKALLALVSLVICFVLVFGVYRFYSSEFNSARDDSVAELVFANFYVRPIALEEVAEVFPGNYSYQYFETYIRGFNFLVPGAGKGVGVWLKEDILGKDFAGAGYNPGVVGEFYLSFGMTTLFALMVFYGWVIGAASRIKVFRDDKLNVVVSSSVSFYLILAMSPGISVSILPILWSFCSIIAVSMLMKLV